MSTTRSLAAYALSLFAALSLAPGAASAGEVGLRPKFHKGDAFRYAIDGLAHNTTKAEMLPDGQSQQVVSQETRVSFKVVEVSDQDATIEAVYERIKMDVKSPMPGMPPAFDSDEPAEKDEGNTLAPVLRPIIGATITLKVALSGAITEVKSPRPGEAAGQFGALAGQFLDPGVVKSNFAWIFSLRNESGVAEVGSRWSVVEEQTLSPGASLAEKFDLTLTAVEAEAAKVSLEGSSNLKVTGGQMQGAKTEDSSIKGAAVWDTGLGMLRTLDVKSFMRISAQPQEGMVLVLETDRAQSLRRLD